VEIGLVTVRFTHLTNSREAGKIEIDGHPVRVSWHRALPLPVFVCPACERDCYRLHEFRGAWRCRKCHALDYACRHRHRSIPGYHRALWLRRCIGVGPRLFSPIAPRPRWHKRYNRAVEEIRQLEARLLGYLRTGPSLVASLLFRSRDACGGREYYKRNAIAHRRNSSVTRHHHFQPVEGQRAL
jgi:hypothetical protein